jgi:hypothetical protein
MGLIGHLSVFLLFSLSLSSSFSSFKNFPVVGLRSRPALPLVPEPLEGSGGEREGRGEEEEVREPREANLASYNDGEVASYSDVSSLDDEFIEEALFLSPEDRDPRDVDAGSFEDWAEEEAEEEGEIVEVARAERDGLGGHHGAHHRAGHDMPERQVVRRRGSRRQQEAGERQVEERQRPREAKQTGDIGPAFGVLSNPPNQEGDYNFNFANDDGSSRQEASGPAGVRGSYSFVTPEGEEVNIQYVADETGFHATGSHVPQAPPMPPAIRRMLDHLAKVNGHAKLY